MPVATDLFGPHAYAHPSNPLSRRDEKKNARSVQSRHQHGRRDTMTEWALSFRQAASGHNRIAAVVSVDRSTDYEYSQKATKLLGAPVLRSPAVPAFVRVPPETLNSHPPAAPASA